MRLGRQIIVFWVASGLLYSTGCAKKSPQLPQQAKVPVDTVPSDLPVEISEEAPPTPPQEAPKQEAPQPEQPPKPAQHHKKKPASPPASTQPAASTPAPASPPNTTIAAARPPANPARPDPAINADVSSAELSQQKQTTAQLLDETEKTLGGLNRTLSHNEEEMLGQIRSYIGQSRNATKEGDYERAFNLATKAHLLCDALVKK
jgi:hypothetical protein